MLVNFENHPCFNVKSRHKFGRVHLPVAPKCNMQCNFCNRKYDCVNESRPGVTSSVLSPEQALVYLGEVFDRLENISVVGIAGPGDPFANPEETMATLRLVRQHYPAMILCLASNGLNLAPYVDELAELQVSHVTVTVNAVDPAIGAKIYSWIRYGKKTRRPEEGAEILWAKQLEAITALKKKDITVKVNTIIMPGVNEDHVESVAQKMAELKVDILNCMSYYPTPGSAFENLTPPHPRLVTEVRRKARQYLPQMQHCARCRADAVGMLGASMNTELMQKLREAAALPKKSVQPRRPSNGRPYIAVASLEGMLVNQHLGEASQLLIYGQDNGSVKLIETRQTPAPGKGMERWQQLADMIADCQTLLVSGIGSNPKQLLSDSGLDVLEIEGVIEEATTAIFEGNSLNHLIKRDPTVCGTGCSGTATGC